MSGKRVAEGVRCDSLRELCPPDRLVKSFLNMLFMQMITPTFLRILQNGQRLLREKPLPDEILRSFRVFLFELIFKKHARVAHRKILIVKFFYYLKLCR